MTIAVFPAEPGPGVSKSWGTEGDPSSFSEFWEAGVQGGEEGTSSLDGVVPVKVIRSWAGIAEGGQELEKGVCLSFTCLSHPQLRWARRGRGGAGAGHLPGPGRKPLCLA